VILSNCTFSRLQVAHSTRSNARAQRRHGSDLGALCSRTAAYNARPRQALVREAIGHSMRRYRAVGTVCCSVRPRCNSLIASPSIALDDVHGCWYCRASVVVVDERHYSDSCAALLVVVRGRAEAPKFRIRKFWRETRASIQIPIALVANETTMAAAAPATHVQFDTSMVSHSLNLLT
jgi:hypothetical protein